MCKAPLEHVYVFESPQAMRPFSSLQIWGTNAGPGVVYDDRAQARVAAFLYARLALCMCAVWCGVV
jgi:hypothetical protein